MGGFEESAYCRWLIRAQRHFEAVDVLIKSSKYVRGILFLPALQLTAHGVELLLKANLISAGWTPDNVKKKFSHNLAKLWHEPKNKGIRDEAVRVTVEVHTLAAQNPRWCFAPDFHPGFLEEQIERLAQLHGDTTQFALRYPQDGILEGPQVPFLVETFGGVNKIAYLNEAPFAP
ncbi:hypothetical protein [Ancylobacter aquaticus]|uniref:hypothetical protein n=1 Tax=Ancylobacter aquaticus TaxID=100 RepID=UPI001043DCF6|nr:hypothetical protein [Ancylobacter aquaticus]